MIKGLPSPVRATGHFYLERRPTSERSILSKMHYIIFPVTIVATQLTLIDNDIPCERDLVLIREVYDLYSQEYEKQIRRFEMCQEIEENQGTSYWMSYLMSDGTYSHVRYDETF